MRELLLSLLTGAVFGATFTLLKFPLPAPTTASGVAGIVGVYLGMVLVSSLSR
ncbi:MAG: XapX domain-containing protein [Pseudomonadota bacterium]|jgi:XapX domain-containing protein